MTTKIYEDVEGRQITEYMSSDGLKLEIWADPWKLSPDDAQRIGEVLMRWSVKQRAEDGIAKPKWSTWP